MWKLFVTWAARSHIDEIVAKAVDDASDGHKRHEARAIEEERLQIADALRAAGYTAVALAVHEKKEIPAPDKVPLQNWVRHTKRRLPW